jgi:hypothetical protein
MAKELLAAALPRRWSHVEAVGLRAARLGSALLIEDDSDVLTAAAWLHDVGYAPAIAVTGFHPLDGARWLRSVGFDARVTALGQLPQVITHLTTAKPRIGLCRTRSPAWVTDWPDQKRARVGVAHHRCAARCPTNHAGSPTPPTSPSVRTCGHHSTRVGRASRRFQLLAMPVGNGVLPDGGGAGPCGRLRPLRTFVVGEAPDNVTEPLPLSPRFLRASAGALTPRVATARALPVQVAAVNH